MTDRPIMFSSAMVRALIDGRKTQTRRLASSPLRHCQAGDRLWVREAWACHWATDDQKPRDIDPTIWSVRYLADDVVRPAARDGSLADVEQCRKGRPGMFMPRWASRLTLHVESVRVEPLQSISEADAQAEGIERVDYVGDVEEWRGTSGWRSYETIDSGPRKGQPHPHAAVPNRLASTSYRELWDILHMTSSRWAENPDVLVLAFRVEQRNIDHGA